jgi:hypothetical protein
MALKSPISTRRYGGAVGTGMDPRDMWKDPESLRPNKDADFEFIDDMKVYSTTKRVEDDIEYFEIDPYLELEPQPDETPED